MSKIFYSIDVSTQGYPVTWLDEYGRKHTDLLGERGDSPADVDQEFRIQHRGAHYLKWDAFCAHLAMVAHDKEELARWNQGLSI